MCWYCGSPITDPEPLGRSLMCSACGKDLRSCKNCRHYRPGSCAETQAEKPSEPERANFCDWFSLNPGYKKSHAGERKPADIDAVSSAKSAFDNLFK